MSESKTPPAEGPLAARPDALKKEATRQVVALVVRLLLLGFGIWFGFVPAALPEGVHVVSRIGLFLLFLIASMLVGEVSSLRLHFSIMLSSIQAAKAQAGQTRADMKADPRLAIDTLVGALAADDEETREKVAMHLARLTGQDFGDDRAAWEAWWSAERPKFGGN